jgi:hypothetical protein
LKVVEFGGGERKNCPKCGKPLGDLVTYDTKTMEVFKVLAPNFWCNNCQHTLSYILQQQCEKL